MRMRGFGTVLLKIIDAYVFLIGLMYALIGIRIIHIKSISDSNYDETCLL